MFKKINEDKFLYDLSKEFFINGKKLFLVGGSVRDTLLNRPSKEFDYDICGDASVDEIVSFLTKLGVKEYKLKNKKLQTLSIKHNGKVYEYARFRKEYYACNNLHSPTKVEFISSVEEDAKRRDFTINSIYYDRYNSKLIDPLNGIKDLNKKVIKTSSNEDTLSVDPARILRLIELASRLNFKISKKVLKIAKKQASNVYKMPVSRLNVELERIKQIQTKEIDKESYKKRLIKNFKLIRLTDFVDKLV